MWVNDLSTVVQVDERFRVTIPRKLRRVFRMSVGERLYVIASGDVLLLRRVPQDPSRRLDELAGDLKLDREARRRAEEWLLREAKGRF